MSFDLEKITIENLKLLSDDVHPLDVFARLDDEKTNILFKLCINNKSIYIPSYIYGKILKICI